LKAVTLFTREGCGLCEDAHRLLVKLEREIRFTLEVVDIDRNMEVHDRYWLRIPVVLVDGAEAAAAPIEEKALRKALAD
jgi:glutaredoxin